MSERQDDGQSKSEPTSLIVYQARSTAPIASLFSTEPRLIDATVDAAPAAESEPSAANAPTMSRAASGDDARPTADKPRPEAAASSGGGESDGCERAATRPRSSRLSLLAASVALAAGLGAAAGSLGFAALGHDAPALAAAMRAEAPEDARAVMEQVAQLRANVKALADQLAAIRAASTASTATLTGQLAKIAEALDRVEQAEHRPVATPVSTPAPQPAAPAAPPADNTASITSGGGPTRKPSIVAGWVVRKVYDGSALVEGRYGMIEVEPGMSLPGLGRIQEIRRQDGHWVVVTARGMIMPLR